MARKLLLFDLDWTLVYTGGAGISALNHAFQQLYNEPDAMSPITPDGKTDPAICRELILFYRKRDPKPGEVQALCEKYLERLAAEVPSSSGYKVLPGIQVLMDALTGQTEAIVGLGTGNLEEGARIKLARANLMRYFSFGGYGSDAEERPLVLRTGVKRGEALAKKTFAPKDVIVIGDNIRDVAAGKAIGATTIAVASGPMSLDQLAATRPDHVFKDLSDTAKVMSVLLS